MDYDVYYPKPDVEVKIDDLQRLRPSRQQYEFESREEQALTTFELEDPGYLAD